MIRVEIICKSDKWLSSQLIDIDKSMDKVKESIKMWLLDFICLHAFDYKHDVDWDSYQSLKRHILWDYWTYQVVVDTVHPKFVIKAKTANVCIIFDDGHYMAMRALDTEKTIITPFSIPEY